MNADTQAHKLTPHVVLAGYDAEGSPAFITDQHFQEMAMGALAGVVSLWESPCDARIPEHVGGFPTDAGFAAAGRIKFGKSWIAPATEGELDFTGADSETFHVGEDARFHATDTLDFGVVVEGEAELELGDDQTATLAPGSCFVLAGIQHKWRIVSDVPFVFYVFTLGAERTAGS